MTTSGPLLLHTRAELAAAAPPPDVRSGVVLTMGALHAGHVALVRRVREAVGPRGRVLLTVFVNPLQFGPGEDLDRYPRDLDADVATAGAAGVDLVWAPSAAQVYPDGAPLVRVEPGPLGEELEGAARPGHFGGVLTVVAKLFGLVRAHVTAFGEKDYQQMVLVRRMATDLELGVEVLATPTQRDPDGLALSSRNARLGSHDRREALALSRALAAGAEQAGAGAAAALGAARAVLADAPGVAVDYLVLRDPGLGPPPPQGPGRLLVAGRVGGVRLIDNRAVEVG